MRSCHMPCGACAGSHGRCRIHTSARATATSVTCMCTPCPAGYVGEGPACTHAASLLKWQASTQHTAARLYLSLHLCTVPNCTCACAHAATHESSRSRSRAPARKNGKPSRHAVCTLPEPLTLVHGAMPRSKRKRGLLTQLCLRYLFLEPVTTRLPMLLWAPSGLAPFSDRMPHSGDSYVKPLEGFELHLRSGGRPAHPGPPLRSPPIR